MVDLDAAVIGKVTDTKRWVIKATPGYDPLAHPPSKRAPVVACDIPIGVLTDEAPVYDRPRGPAGSPRRHPSTRRASSCSATSGARCSISWPRSTSLARVGGGGSVDRGSTRGGTIVRPGPDAAVVRVPREKDGKTVEQLLAFAVDRSGRMCELDPFIGGAMATASRCAATCAGKGAEPIMTTDCLNFGNLERPEGDGAALARGADGIFAARNALGVLIVSGNVSLCNETDGRSILPTPAVAAVGLVASRDDVVTAWFKRPGDAVLLLGEAASGGARALGGSEWLVRAMGKLAGEALLIELAAEAAPSRSFCSFLAHGAPARERDDVARRGPGDDPGRAPRRRPGGRGRPGGASWRRPP